MKKGARNGLPFIIYYLFSCLIKKEGRSPLYQLVDLFLLNHPHKPDLLPFDPSLSAQSPEV